MIRYRKGVQISGLIYFHRISDATPVEGTPLRNWRAFEKICGDRFSKVVLATTMWGNADNVDNNVGMKEQELGDFWKVKARGWSMQRFLRNHLSAADVLVPILEHVTKRPLQLQTEISDFHLSLVQTSAARVLFLQLQAHLRRCQKEQKDILHDMANRGIGKLQLQKLEERLRKSYSRSKKIEEGLTKLQEKRAEHGQRFMLRTPGVGTVFRSVCLRRYYLLLTRLHDFNLQNSGFAQAARVRPHRFRIPHGLRKRCCGDGERWKCCLGSLIIFFFRGRECASTCL